MNGAPSSSVWKLVAERLPISQKVMAGSTSWGSATYLIIDTSAENSELTTMPPKIIITMFVPPRTRLTA